MTAFFEKYRFTKLAFITALLSVLTAFALKAQTVSLDSTALEIEWSTERLAKGVYWKSYLGDDLYDSKQSINLIEVVLDSAEIQLKIAFDRDSLMGTSDFAERQEALAAINGSFFNRVNGGSVVFLKVDNEVISSGVPDRDIYTENGGIGWTNERDIRILAKPDNGWVSAEQTSILGSGPLLIYNNETQIFNNNPFHQNRHPRSAVAISNDNRLYLVTVDGRSFQAYGMTIPELAQFFTDLGASYALNLDGGGSTSMWIRNKTENGIVNHPSDNLEFDNEGERDVANALLILPRENL